MGWKQINGNRYYYRIRRVGSQVISEYHGSGLYGALASMEDHLEAESQKEEREAWMADLNRFKIQDQAINGTLTLITNVTYAALMQSGYHQHKRQWRKIRGRKIDTQTS